ncbi:MAG: oligopeptidase A [Gammaproteobacteria bacterium]|nr:oligopeptidase A [Gammaproteobacteria bacterium]MBT3490489.1 oligopeptidase A [Gammaproteobacteria bacterium]MBT3719952.1 oligopeptidase A [Gammaproteobacteria bacterium]MBT3843793.1 oligopeptidase A [Gammaproteobacteria bacterium]MBT3894192.1 oligopeptidase A [Gammaproteobacteria bacterium]
MSEKNPLLEMEGLPPFSQIEPHHALPAIEALLKENRDAVDQLLSNEASYQWESLVQPLEEMEDRLGRVWSPVSHLNSVKNSPELREAYNRCLPLLSDYATEMGQHQGLHNAFREIAESENYRMLEPSQKKIIENALRDFRLSGIDLPIEKQQRFREISQSLSQLTSRFGENVLDATNQWEKLITDESLLAGLSDAAKAMARQTAEQRGQEGWLFTLEFPSYIAVMTYADNRQLREELYEAYVTRASDQGPHDKGLDNTPIMEQILQLRHEKAKLLGFDNYAEYSLSTKMAETADQVIRFLEDLAQRSLGVAKQELEELRQFAKERDSLEELQSWDLTYYAEKLKEQCYSLSEEALKPWFPVDRVLEGMFEVVHRLYGITIQEQQGVDLWDQEARFFSVTDREGALRGQFYTDLFARPQKRGGAWMDDCITRRKMADGVQVPVAYLTCNFTPPIGEAPALLTHDEVLTMFHEFGHGLHHLMTQIDFPSVAGIGGVPWDAVELPSQFMENWCWQEAALPLFSGHYQTGEPLSKEKFEQLLASRNFQAGMAMVRQLEFALFDFKMHLEYDPQKAQGNGEQVYAALDVVRDQVAVMKPPSFNRFPHSFSHIFAGGYAAGYYSYKWAEVLSSDAFAHFEENGIFDADTGLRFLASILEQGGSREPMELFIEFRGREPQIDALLRHSGISL